MLYLLLEIDPGDISPYDLMWDQRIIDQVSEIGAVYPVKIMIVQPSPETMMAFSTVKAAEKANETDDPIQDDPAANYQDGPCGDH